MRKRVLDVTLFGSLFLILMIIMVGSGISLPRGLMVSLPTAQPCPGEDIVNRSIVVRVLGSGDVEINDYRVGRGLLRFTRR